MTRCSRIYEGGQSQTVNASVMSFASFKRVLDTPICILALEFAICRRRENALGSMNAA
jgi:hypothetical protein